MRTYKLIGGDSQEYGPATHEEVCQWISEGRLSFQSLAKAEAEDSWRELCSFKEFEDALGEQVRKFGLVVADAGAPSVPPPNILGAAPAGLNIARCLGRSSQLLGANFGLLLGAASLTWMLGLAAQLLPFVGGFVYLLLEGVLFGGLYLVYLRAIRGEPAAISNIFNVYGEGMGQLVLAGLLTSVLTTLGFLFCFIPGLYLLVAWVFALPLIVDRRLEFWAAMEQSRRVVTRSWFQVALLLLFAFLPVALMYVYAQVKIFAVAYPGLQQLLQSGTADAQSLNTLMTEVARVSVPLALLNKVVLLFNLPFAAGAVMFAYEDLFGKPRQTPKD